jgi:hypothetical protein
MLYTRCILPPNLESPLDPIKRQQRQTRPQPEQDRPHTEVFPSVPLFAHPITVEPLDLPFSEPSAEPSTGFYRLLKTLISGRFLSRRRSRSG